MNIHSSSWSPAPFVTTDAATLVTTVSEQYLLGVEREAFLTLRGDGKTIERIQYPLKTGRPLRN